MNTIGYKFRNKRIEITLNTIDHYCKDNNIESIDFIKIDVEGYELSVLKGGMDFFSKGGVKMVQFEYGNASIAARIFLKDFFDFFTNFNFSIYKIMHKGLLPQRYSPFNEKISYANFLAVSNAVNIDKKFIINRKTLDGSFC